jgi:putative DNA primase/helicase
MTASSDNDNALANVEIVGEGFDDLHHRFIKLKVKGSDRDLSPYSMDDILKPERLYRELGDAGCKLFSRQLQNQLQAVLQNYKQTGKSPFSVVTRLGSFRDFYVRPNKIVGNPPRPVELALGPVDSHLLQKYRCRGSLQSWQERIGTLCNGNSRLLFAASLACTGPILPFVDGPRTGGFQISGMAESGKTTMGMVAGSVWGCHRDSIRKDKGFAESWNTTINKVEETAQAHCDALLILDETNLAGDDETKRARVSLDGAFRLSENIQKGRFNEPRTAAWRFYFLSTSNLTLHEMADRGGTTIGDQHRGRLVDIVLPGGPGTFGIYEDLHGFIDGAALTDAIKSRCRTVFGTPGYRLVRKIYQTKNSRSSAKKFVSARRNYYITCIRKEAKSKGLKPLERATAMFATVYAAGCLAIKYGVFTWSWKELFRAVLSCQLDGLGALGKPDQVTNLRRALVDRLIQSRPAFKNLNITKLPRKTHALGSSPGYVHTHRGKDWIYLTSDQLKAIIGTGKVANRLLTLLVEEGLMAGTGKRALVQRPVFKGTGNKGYRWVHAFLASLLDNSIVAPRRRALNKKR